MSVFNVIIVEDDDNDYKCILDYLTRYFDNKDIELNCSRFISGEDFLKTDTSKTNLVFMDIMLKGINGMDTAKSWREKDSITGLIFITNMFQYAIEGYSTQALDYILKPVNYYSLAMKLDRAIKILHKTNNVTISLKVDGGTKVVNLLDVLLVEVMGHDVSFITSDSTLTTYGNLKQYEDMLRKNGFSRCSATALINLSKVEGIYGDEIHLLDGKKIPIGRSKKKSFLSDFSQYQGGNL